jgi:hypothetical protein
MTMVGDDDYVLREALKLLNTTIAGQCDETVLEGEGPCVAGQMPLAMYPPENCHYPRGCCSCVCSKKHVTADGRFFCPSYCPHPLCTTAANIFVPLTMIDFASQTGQTEWLKSVLPRYAARVRSDHVCPEPVSRENLRKRNSPFCSQGTLAARTHAGSPSHTTDTAWGENLKAPRMSIFLRCGKRLFLRLFSNALTSKHDLFAKTGSGRT